MRSKISYLEKLTGDDVAVRILLYLDPFDLLSMALVSKHWKTLADRTAAIVIEYLKSRGQLSIPSSFSSRCINKSLASILCYATKPRGMLLGGGNLFEGRESFLRFDLYDFVAREWRRGEALSVPHGTIKTEAISGQSEVYVVGGEDSESADAVERYSIFTEKWEVLPIMPRKLLYSSATIVASHSHSAHESLVVSGGLMLDTMQPCNEVHCFDTPSQRWVTLTALLQPARYGHASARFKSGLIIAGGKIADNSGTASTQLLLSMSDSQWVNGPAMTTRRMWPRLLTISKAVYAVGGDVDDNGNNLFPTIERLTFNGTDNDAKWEKVTILPKLRRIFAATAVDNKIYIVGGKDEYFGVLTCMDVYDTATGSWADGAVVESKSTNNVKEFNCQYMVGETRVIESPAKNVSNVQGSPQESSTKELDEKWLTIPREKLCGGQAVTIPANPTRWNQL